MSVKPIKYFILNSPEDIQPCDADEYFDWHSRQDEADKTVLGIRLELTKLKNGVIISTIFCGDDKNGYLKSGPLLFETRVADPLEYFTHFTCNTTGYYEALNQHSRVVRQVKKHYKLEVEDAAVS